MVFSEQIAQTIKRVAAEAGFELAGIAPVREEDFPEVAAFVAWIEAGPAGEMKYMEKRTEAGDPRPASAKNAAPWVRPAVVFAPNYSAGKPYSVEVNDPRRGWISPYALGSKE